MWVVRSLWSEEMPVSDCALVKLGDTNETRVGEGMIGMSKEHLAVALALSVPVVVAITKVRLPQSGHCRHNLILIWSLTRLI